MKYGIKTNGQMVPSNPGPADWPSITVAYLDDDTKVEQNLLAEGFTILGEISYNAYIADHQAEYDAWAATYFIESLRLEIRDLIDAKTDELINVGITYQGMSFKLDLAHQNSYMFDYMLNQEYPHTIKGVGTDYLTLATHDEFTQFVSYCFGAVDALIRNGWEMKDDLVNMTYQQLLEWTDPRT